MAVEQRIDDTGGIDPAHIYYLKNASIPLGP